MEIAAFWTLLEQSQLVPEKQLTSLKSEFVAEDHSGPTKKNSSGNSDPTKPADSTAPASQVEKLADWLVAKKVLTDYHKTVLLAGHAGPFHYGDYQVTDRISQGFLNGAFLAKHVPTSHPVLLRFVASDVSVEGWVQLADKIKKRSEVRNDGLISFYEPVDLVRFRFLATQVPSQTRLSDLLEKKPKLSARRASLLMYRLASAVALMHSKGVIHGDLRPQSIVGTKTENAKIWHDAMQQPKKLAEIDPTSSPADLQRVEYMAPELADPNQEFNELTDIYALGVLFYRLLSGKEPFTGDDPLTIIQKHAADPIDSLKPVGVPGPIEKVIKFMMAKQTQIRFQTADDVVAQLGAILKTAKLELPDLNAKPSGLEQAYLDSIRQKQVSPVALPEAVGLPPATAGSHETSTPSPDSIPTLAPTPTHSVTPSQPTATPASAAHSSPTSNIGQPLGAPVSLVETDPEEKRAVNRFKRKSSRLPLIIGVCVLLLVGVPIGLYVVMQSKGSANANSESDDPSSTNPSATDSGDDSSIASVPTAFEQVLVETDDQILWETPTAGYPIDLEFIPLGLRILLVVRPQALLELDTGDEIIQSLGPNLNERLDETIAMMSFPLSEISQLCIGFHDNNGMAPRPSYRIRFADAKQISDLDSKWSRASIEDNPGLVAYEVNESWHAAAIFSENDASLISGMVFSTPEDIVEIVQSEGAPPLLRQDLRQLLRYSDRDRHFTLAAIPSSVFNDEGRRLFTGGAESLVAPLSKLVGDGIGAVMLSAHLDQDLYLEAMVRGQLDQDPPQLEQDLKARLQLALKEASDFVFKLDSNPFWDDLRMRFPSWVILLNYGTRTGIENGVVIANSWLPGASAHNFLLASELAVSSSGGQVVSSATQGGDSEADQTPKNLEELLEVVFDLEIPKNDMVLIVEEIKTMVKSRYPGLPFEFDIKLMGNDLQLEAITQNQSVRDFNMKQKKLHEILTALMVRANPVSDVSGPADPNVKLVWVSAPDPDNPEVTKILVTTRAGVARENYKLPPAFELPK